MRANNQNMIKISTVSDVFEQQQKVQPEGFLKENEIRREKQKEETKRAELPTPVPELSIHARRAIEARKFTGKPKLTISDKFLDDDDVRRMTVLSCLKLLIVIGYPYYGGRGCRIQSKGLQIHHRRSSLFTLCLSP